jgi:ABC-type nickel/cobalt efflux system permease component RcnA
MNGLGLIAAILTQLPVYLVWLVGVILALANWKKHPSVSLVALIGFVILFLLALFTQLTTVRHGVNWSHAGIAFLEALIRAGAWGLVLAAIFGWRK